MSNLVIRGATEQGIPAVQRLYRTAEIDGEGGFAVGEAIAHFTFLKSYPSFQVFVAAVGEIIVGTYELVILDNMAKRGRKSGVVEDVAVDPDRQGHGIGRAMMQHALDQCRLAPATR